MDSKRRSYFRNYAKSSNNYQDPIAGTSKSNDPMTLNVVRKLTFQTPQKKKTTRKTKNTCLNKSNQSKQNPETSEPVFLNQAEKTTALLNTQQIYDLTDESNNSHQKENDIMQKELEIFREISRQHEIEEACDQIQREHFDNDDEMDINDFNSERKNMPPANLTADDSNKLNDILEEENLLKIDIQEVNMSKAPLKNTEKQVQKNDNLVTLCVQNNVKYNDVKIDLPEIFMDLNCAEDFKEIDIVLQKNKDTTNNTSMNNIKTKTETKKEDNNNNFCKEKKIPHMDNDEKSDSIVQLEKNKKDNHEDNHIADLVQCQIPEQKLVKSTISTEDDMDVISVSPKIIKNNEDIQISAINSEKRQVNQIDNENNCIFYDNVMVDSIISEEKEIQTHLITPAIEINSNNNDVPVLCNDEIRSGENSGNSSQGKNETPQKHNKYVKNKRLRQQKRQKYVDFLSDNEDFVWSSSSWEGSESELSESGIRKKKPKKTKQKKKTFKTATKSTDDGPTDTGTVSEKKKLTNIRKETKTKRESGKEYCTKKGKVMPAKDMKSNPCSLSNCVNNCYEISEDRRNTLFSHFWSLDSVRRRDWLVSHSKKQAVKRHRSSDITKRTNTLNYFINEGEGQRRVCQKFLVATLDIKQKTLYNTVINSLHGSASEDMRGKHVPSNKTPDLVIENLRKYIQELPALPSHYCRKNSKRTYLPQEFRNVTNLYRIYKQTQENNGLQYVGEKVFKKIFTDDYNIGFHFPRKDKCLKCTQFENDKNSNEEAKNKHLKDKEETIERFKAHQEINKKDDTILCTTFDLQKVLNTPHGENMMLYYSRKLAVYNLTFYESGTRNGFCYTWTEIDGKRGANEVSSILQKYINEVDQRGTIKHLLLYCDSCPGQNKNKIVLACLNEILQTCNNLISIQINYLLPGHTYMPVDSIHSVIEKSLSGVIIWAPSQWSTVFTLARKSPKPYEVEVLTYTDFSKWDTIADKYFKGNLVGKTSKLRTVTFKKSAGNIAFVKYSMNPDAETQHIEITKKKDAVQLKPCYKALLPVSKRKYMDLNKLCTSRVIPTVYHQEYKRLNYANNVQDSLIDTDIEDEEKSD